MKKDIRVIHRFILVLILAFFTPALVLAQIMKNFHLSIKWTGATTEAFYHDTISVISFENACYDPSHPLVPYCYRNFDVHSLDVETEVVLSNVVFDVLTAEEVSLLNHAVLSEDYELEVMKLSSREQRSLGVKVIPLRYRDGRYEKLLSADVSLKVVDKERELRGEATWVGNSVLASGNWYKVAIQNTGIQRLGYSDLLALGIDVNGIDPRKLKIYHNGGGVLPEPNATSRHQDLVELPIYVYGESDGRFDANDYVLFYARGPVVWSYDAVAGRYIHKPNPYDACSYAYVTIGAADGKRIHTASEPTGSIAATITDFVDFQVHENDDINLINMGRNYFGDRFDGGGSKSFVFHCPNAVTNKPSKMFIELAARNFSSAQFHISVDGDLKSVINILSTTSSSTSVYARPGYAGCEFYPKSSSTNVGVKYVPSSNLTAIGFIDYIAVNVWRRLSFEGGQMSFRSPETSNSASLYRYTVSNVSSTTQIWDVTNPVDPTRVETNVTGTTASFVARGAVDNEFIAFDGSHYHTPRAVGHVDNQNLHAVRNVDYLMIVHPLFMAQAERLKDIHASYNPDLTVFITTPEMIYNEFSCGAVDVTAIRDFCRKLYLDSDPGKELKYLLCFGDASFDYKNRNGLVNYVPTYETHESIDNKGAFVTDDYYAYMDEHEGVMQYSLPDFGVGRFPVSTVEQAMQMVDKVENYIRMDDTSLGPWRNVITFVADDDTNEFVEDPERFEQQIKQTGGENLVVDKIYLDAYEQQSSPSGQLAPQVNETINNRIEKGTLVMNYMGHGGEVQLTEERIMQRADVNSWRNGPKYPLMVTGTCEFSRYDDHDRTSLGEYAFLNQYGGMIAMFTTSRVTYSNSNRSFVTGVFDHLFQKDGGQRQRLGDVYYKAKRRFANSVGVSYEDKRYVFFGDPALRLAYPTWTVETTSINGHDPLLSADTIRALQHVVIGGAVINDDGVVANDFNGVVYVSVYDKEAELTTLGLGGGSSPMPFKLRNSVIFNGKTEVVDGRFEISFIVPRDISFRYGSGMISYYATDYVNEANGKFEDLCIGGFDLNAQMDEEGPDIKLFIDDTLFVDGGLTNENPFLIASVEDKDGINTTGTGIGHDITATLTGPSSHEYRLNDYFISEMNNPGKGEINFRMLNLADGRYTLTLKVWDVYNNSSVASINFVVNNSKAMAMEDLINYPNPFGEETYISFSHNQVGSNLDVVVQIFDITGRLVTTLEERVMGTTARTTPIRWDGKNSEGRRVAAGMYVYRVLATNDEGVMSALTSKMIVQH